MAKNLEGAALAGLRDYKDAERLLLDSQEGLSRAALPGVAKAGRARLADLYTALGNPVEASKFRNN
jgi:hypothetical protein